MNSQHFSHINVQGPYKCMRSELDLAVKRLNVNVGPSFSNFGISPVAEYLCKDNAPQLIWFLRRRFLKVFTRYGHGSHLGQWTMTILAIFRSPNL